MVMTVIFQMMPPATAPRPARAATSGWVGQRPRKAAKPSRGRTWPIRRRGVLMAARALRGRGWIPFTDVLAI